MDAAYVEQRSGEERLIPLRDRVVEVLCDRGESSSPRSIAGSGLFVGDGLVLTAAHVAGPGTLWVRGVDKRLRRARCLLRGDQETADLALLVVGDRDAGAANLGGMPGLRFASVTREGSEAASIERCWAVGYPRFQSLPGRAGKAGNVRETAQVDGVIPTMDGLHSGLLTLRVTAAPRPLPAREPLNRSPWSGMSGAVVLCGQVVVGVVTEHRPPRGDSALTVTPITRIAELPDAERWWRALGVSRDDLIPLPGPSVAAAPYRMTVAEVARRTRLLIGRERELALVRAFATGDEGYLWLCGAPWAGKTALAAHVLGACGPDVDAVGYFLQQRVSDADATHFLTAVIPQLCELVGQEPATFDTPAFIALWARAVARAKQLRRHLLLVVDGLDEDLAPAGTPSVASLLPTEVGGYAHVLVTSRSHPPLPFDVDVGHPLRTARREPLSQTRAARLLNERAEQDLRQLTGRVLGGEAASLGRTVLGVLAAAAGPLAVDDLADIAGVDPFDVARLLDGPAGRVVERLTVDGATSYRFAHQSLLDRCDDALLGERRLDEVHERLYAWAARWAEEGWPIGRVVPRYLVGAYPNRLVVRGDLERIAGLVTDAGWLDVAIAAVGVDEVRAVLTGAVRLAAVRATADAAAAVRAIPAVARIVERAAWGLRLPESIQEPGHVARQLALAALSTADVADVPPARWQQRVAAHRRPQLVPRWVSRPEDTALVRTLAHDGAWVAALAVAPGGTVLTAGSDWSVRLWDIDGRQPPRLLGRHTGAVTAALFTPDGRGAVTGGDDGAVLLWAAADGGTAPRTVGRHEGAATSGCLAPDGRSVVTAGEDGTIRSWDLSERRPGRLLATTGTAVTAVAVTRAGQMVFGTDDGVVHLIEPWATGTSGGGTTRTLGRHDGAVCAVATSGGWVVSGGTDNAVRAWSLVGSVPSRLLGTHADWVTGAAAAADGRIVTASRDGEIRVWQLRGHPETSRPIGRHDADVAAVALTADGAYVVSGGARELRVWRGRWPLSAGAEPGPVGRVRVVALAGDGCRAATGGPAPGPEVWHVSDGGVAGMPGQPAGAGADGPPSALALSPDGRWLVAAGRRLLRRWELTGTGHRPRSVPHHVGTVRHIAVAADGRLVMACGDGSIQVWRPDSGEEPYVLGDEHGDVVAMALVEDRVITADAAGTLRVAAVAAADSPRVVGRHAGRLGSLAPTPDGTAVVAGDVGGLVRIWHVASTDGSGGYATPPRTLGRHTGPVLAAAVAGHGRHALTGGEDGIRGWDMATGVEALHVPMTGVMALCAAVAPADGGYRCVSASVSGLTIWTLLE